ncbi:MAG: penicillin-binding transpeptidase domain-containing protein [Bacteriovoracaceae bacterium]|nr:penicillin-binding transpeptidase domain-containing protein [Bacteriovoracaceae bacterium]
MKRIKDQVRERVKKIGKHPKFKTVGIPVLVIFILLGILVPINRWHQNKSIENFSFLEQAKLSSYWLDLERLLQNSFEVESPYWPSLFSSAGEQYNVNYTYDLDLMKYLKDLISLYPSDFTSVVVIENSTGQILAAIDHERKTNKFDKKVTFSATSPAASLFKVITAADVIQNRNVSSITPFGFWGRKTTLYRNQLRAQPRDREIPFKKAFAESNNVVFGKAALQYSDSLSLFKTAESFGFNRNLIELLDTGKSFFPLAESEYNLAELGSGLNTMTMISPVHAAKIAAIIANGGKDFSLKLVKSITQHSNGAEIFPPPAPPEKMREVITPHTTEELRIMMREAVENGTARMIRKKMNRKIYEQLDMGGKTGQMTGGIPQGKRDWFILYASPKNDPQKGISIAVMLVNQEHWYIRSVFLAMKIVEHVYAGLN